MHNNYSEQIQRRSKFNSPEELKELFRLFPLDGNFINWVHLQGFKIFYREDFYENIGSLNYYPRREINVSSKGDSKIVTQVIVHELVHIALTRENNESLMRMELENYLKYEKAIDEITAEHLNNQEFMRCLEEKLPLLTIAS